MTVEEGVDPTAKLDKAIVHTGDVRFVARALSFV